MSLSVNSKKNKEKGGDITMKKIMLVLLFATVAFVGCKKQEAPVAPAEAPAVSTDTVAPAAAPAEPAAAPVK